MDVDASLPLRVGLLVPAMNLGGAQRVSLNLAEGLLELGCKVDLVLFTAAGEMMSAVPDSVRVVDLHCGRALKAPLPLSRYLRRDRPDLLVSAMGHTNLVALLARALAAVPTRTVLVEHSTALARPEGLKVRVYRLLARLAYPRATAVVAVSSGVAESLVREVGLKDGSVRVIYNPVLTKEYWEQVRAEKKGDLFGEDRSPIVLAAGRMVPPKDFPNLLRAFAEVVKQRSARLTILGDGPLRPDLEQQVADLGLADHVVLAGYVDNAPTYMAGADVFVLSSVREGLPTVLIEALAAGAKIVSTDCHSGPREILRDGELGQLVPVGDSPALARAIVSALDAPSSAVPAEALDEYRPRTAAIRYLQAAHLHA